MIFTTDTGQKEPEHHPHGDSPLGALASELEHEELATDFTAAGWKNYALRRVNNGAESFKLSVRGFTIGNKENSERLNFASMRESVCAFLDDEPCDPIRTVNWRFASDKNFGLYKAAQEKLWSVQYNKRIVIKDGPYRGHTVPYGTRLSVPELIEIQRNCTAN